MLEHLKRQRWKGGTVGAAGTKPQINDILLRQSHLKTQTPFVITSSREPSSDVSQVRTSLSSLKTFCSRLIVVTGDSNPPSCTSPVGNPAGVPFARAQTAPTSSWLEQNGQAGASSPEPGVMNTPPSRPESSNSNVQVWKLDNTASAAANSSETSNEQQHQQQPLQSFTLQETLFVEQLAAIDERVRNQVWPRFFLTVTELFDIDSLSPRQVPMDPTHVRSFLNTAVFGTFITKITIMHAYQTCIKRIVRFANSLQVCNRKGRNLLEF